MKISQKKKKNAPMVWVEREAPNDWRTWVSLGRLPPNWMDRCKLVARLALIQWRRKSLVLQQARKINGCVKPYFSTTALRAARTTRRNRGSRQCPYAMVQVLDLMVRVVMEIIKDQRRLQGLNRNAHGCFLNSKWSHQENLKTNGAIWSTMARGIGSRPTTILGCGCSTRYTALSRWRPNNCWITVLRWCSRWMERVRLAGRLINGWTNTTYLERGGWDTPFLKWSLCIKRRKILRPHHGSQKKMFLWIGVEMIPARARAVAENKLSSKVLWWRSMSILRRKAPQDIKKKEVVRAMGHEPRGLSLWLVKSGQDLPMDGQWCLSPESSRLRSIFEDLVASRTAEAAGGSAVMSP